MTKEIYESLPNETKMKMNWSKGKNRFSDKRVIVKYSEEDIFCEKSKVSRSVVKRYLRSEPSYIHRCSKCNLTRWLDKEIVLELEHINGIRNDNRRENLQWLCPNCHSMTFTWRGRNNGKRISVPDEKLIEIIPLKENIAQVLIEVGLAPYGANYARVKKLIQKHNLSLKEKIKPIKIINLNWRHNPRPHTRKAERPSKEILEELVLTYPMVKIGKMYNVTDNSIRKWCKWYGIEIGSTRRTRTDTV